MRAHPRGGRRTSRVELVLPHGSASAGRARRLTKAFLGEGPSGAPDAADVSERVRDAQLVVSELVANATRVGSSHCRLSLRVDADEFTVEVRDDSPDRPVLNPPSATAESGRGIALVHALSRRWSVVGDGHGGKTVRAVLSLN
ncbi:ATP-binding protein [Streptomyces sp. NPDC058001]|uniref:ATP-binding protein n=1 Tax=Streptomyces sp. NPDC058001 TaxID=3346300 RepID=UPI0036ED37B0